MGDRPDPIPDNMSIAEASDFWDTHSVADYPSRVVEMEFTPEGRTSFVAVESNLLRNLRSQAKEAGVSVETLVNLWLQERLAGAPVSVGK